MFFPEYFAVSFAKGAANLLTLSVSFKMRPLWLNKYMSSSACCSLRPNLTLYCSKMLATPNPADPAPNMRILRCFRSYMLLF